MLYCILSVCHILHSLCICLMHILYYTCTQFVLFFFPNTSFASFVFFYTACSVFYIFQLLELRRRKKRKTQIQSRKPQKKLGEEKKQKDGAEQEEKSWFDNAELIGMKRGRGGKVVEGKKGKELMGVCQKRKSIWIRHKNCIH